MFVQVGPLPISSSSTATPMLADGEWLYSRRTENFELDAAFWNLPIGKTVRTSFNYSELRTYSWTYTYKLRPQLSHSASMLLSLSHNH